MAALNPREGAIDALIRFGQGLDNNDASLVTAAFTPDGICDLRLLSSDPAHPLPCLDGIDAVLGFLMPKIGEMDTMHFMGNFQVSFPTGPSEAKVGCYVIAQHFRAGEGPDAEKRGACFGNTYKADVVLMEGAWKVRKLEVKCLWSDGDMSVLA